MTIDPRKEKRYFRKVGIDDPMKEAFDLGTFVAYEGGFGLPPRLQVNPYPAGKRHNEWERGAEAIDHDPMGDYHGRNI